VSTLLISDLHLDPAAPERTVAFRRTLDEDAARADALYILGDLFEAWIGDDDDASLAAEVQDALRGLIDAGVPGYFMRGNRDFLVGAAFARRTGMVLLDDPVVHELGGRPTLLMHGDTLCTGDTEYIALRQRFHDAAWQREFLSQSLERRREFAASARADSAAATAVKDEVIMDVDQAAVRQVMAEHGVQRMVHGHTHRPAIHQLELAGQAARRLVLGAWHDQGWRLWIDADGSERLEAFPL
jgi:UDP-2,3-diacylglucosamine hydrolase